MAENHLQQSLKQSETREQQLQQHSHSESNKKPEDGDHNEESSTGRPRRQAARAVMSRMKEVDSDEEQEQQIETNAATHKTGGYKDLQSGAIPWTGLTNRMIDDSARRIWYSKLWMIIKSKQPPEFPKWEGRPLDLFELWRYAALEGGFQLVPIAAWTYILNRLDVQINERNYMELQQAHQLYITLFNQNYQVRPFSQPKQVQQMFKESTKFKMPFDSVEDKYLYEGVLKLGDGRWNRVYETYFEILGRHTANELRNRYRFLCEQQLHSSQQRAAITQEYSTAISDDGINKSPLEGLTFLDMPDMGRNRPVYAFEWPRYLFNLPSLHSKEDEESDVDDEMRALPAYAVYRKIRAATLQLSGQRTASIRQLRKYFMHTLKMPGKQTIELLAMLATPTQSDMRSRNISLMLYDNIVENKQLFLEHVLRYSETMPGYESDQLPAKISKIVSPDIVKLYAEMSKLLLTLQMQANQGALSYEQLKMQYQMYTQVFLEKTGIAFEKCGELVQRAGGFDANGQLADQHDPSQIRLRRVAAGQYEIIPLKHT